MTKKHEEFLTGRISELLPRLAEPKGEYTVVLEIGHMTEHGAADAHSAADLAFEFGQMKESGGLTRRQIIKELATKYGLPAREVYAAIEASGKSGE